MDFVELIFQNIFLTLSLTYKIYNALLIIWKFILYKNSNFRLKWSNIEMIFHFHEKSAWKYQNIMFPVTSGALKTKLGNTSIREWGYFIFRIWNLHIFIRNGKTAHTVPLVMLNMCDTEIKWETLGCAFVLNC